MYYGPESARASSSMGSEWLVKIFDAATKVTSPFALGAFGIAAVVAIVWFWFSFRAKQSESDRYEVPLPAGAGHGTGTYYQYTPPSPPPPSPPPRSSLPKLALIVLAFVVLVPVAAWAFVATHADLPYLARVLAVDKNLGLVSDPHVVCSVGGGESRFDGGVQFEIPPSSLPVDKSVTFYATTKTSHGDKTTIFGKTRSVSVTIDLVPTPIPPPPQQTDDKAHSTKPLSIDGSWVGTYRSQKQVSASVVSTYTVTIQKDRLIVREDREEDGQTVCNAEWTGTAKQTAPQVLSFTASRKGQTGYFCSSYTTPESIEGTATKSGYHDISVDIPTYVRWRNITLK